MKIYQVFTKVDVFVVESVAYHVLSTDKDNSIAGIIEIRSLDLTHWAQSDHQVRGKRSASWPCSLRTISSQNSQQNICISSSGIRHIILCCALSFSTLKHIPLHLLRDFGSPDLDVEKTSLLLSGVDCVVRWTLLRNASCCHGIQC